MSTGDRPENGRESTTSYDETYMAHEGPAAQAQHATYPERTFLKTVKSTQTELPTT
jgi:hypothetical protein